VNGDSVVPTTSLIGIRTAAVGNRWRCLILAAGVALQQLGPSPERAERPSPAYVLLLPDEPGGFSKREVIGEMVLTESLEVLELDESRLAGNLN